MASAGLRKDLHCPICLSLYTDPVMLRCGHNFCRDCINRLLDIKVESGGYSCPECKQEYQERPALQRNITLTNIVQNLLLRQPDQRETGVRCTYCFDIPVLAVKSCLLCEASLCDKHLNVHSKAPEHVLCDPTSSPETRKCSVHKKVLEYYCTEDSACICVSCSLAGEHRGHQVETLDEASDKKKKNLRDVLQKLMTETEETEKRVQNRRREVQEKAANVTERVTALFREVRRRQEDLETRILRNISRQAEQILLSCDNLIQELETKKEELSRKMRHVEELCDMTDPLTVLQESNTGDLCDIEEGDNKDRERHEELHDGGHLDVAGISRKLHKGLSDIMSGVIVQKHTETQTSPHSSREGKVYGLFRQCPKPTRTQQADRPNIEVVQQTLGLSGYADILLDENTAGNKLTISDHRKSATWSFKSQNHSETPERFECAQVLSSQSFSSGRHYWEVNVSRSRCWIIGMCYSSMDRKGELSEIGDNSKSWGLDRDGDKYSVIHGRKQIPLPDKIYSKKVGIYLNYEAGKISFYYPCDQMRLLHTFTATFTEPLHAALYVGRGRIKISGGKSEHVRNPPRDW